MAEHDAQDRYVDMILEVGRTAQPLEWAAAVRDRAQLLVEEATLELGAETGNRHRRRTDVTLEMRVVPSEGGDRSEIGKVGAHFHLARGAIILRPGRIGIGAVDLARFLR